MKVQKQIFVIIFLLTCGCVGRFEMKKDNFNLENPKVKHPTVFGLKFVYNDKNTSANPVSGCMFHFSGDGLYSMPAVMGGVSESSYKYKVKKNYVFIDNNADDIYLSAIECLNYRFVYSKIRLKKVNKKIFSGHQNYGDKISYGGDLEINWIPKGFYPTDLFNFGHMGHDDKGAFSINLKEDYEGYKKFLKEEYGISSEKSTNAFSKVDTR